ncbi:hypothetical protein [Thermococcus sibiricus]|uniref:DUF4129 domain-containing protein n=1 Tax=Thermococcus sibiricus TaxID=172049 RepID=A0A101ELT9_9EURY|nr:hypothetical protein [Thermococcus sibiricus]KUK17280.1 MAG: Uncharacterized protein XD54_1449 [Thermococcus sibiricus]KUK28033.1 MAG: Uncharacterized protein XD61_1421 [Thermococcus sp. 40_45]
MRWRSFISILIIITILSGFAYAEDYSKVEGDDYGVYLYFNDMLGNFNSIIKDILEDKNDTVIKAESFYSLANVTVEEVVKYNSFGIRPSAVGLAYRFKGLGEGVFILSSSHQRFMESLENGDFLEARTNLFSMKASMDDIYLNLAHVSGIRLIGENGEALNFELEETYEALEKLEGLIERYEERLNRLAAPSEFSIFSSKESPFLHENVTFYGYTLGLENVKVIINSTSYTPEIINGGFRLRYSFNETGLYEVYAQAMNGSHVVTSNVIRIEVQKIPTQIIALEKTGTIVTVEGYLLDYFGSPLKGKEIILEMDGENYKSLTDENGAFSFDLGEFYEEKNVTMSFLGDDEHEGTITKLTLLPPKSKLTIRLFFEESEVREGEEVRIPGYVNGTSDEIPLEVYVDDKLTETINARGNFTLLLRFDRGEHAVYVKFPGNEEFAESVSNIVEVQAIPYNYLERVLLFIVFLVLGFIGYKLLTRRPKVVVETKPKEEQKSIAVSEEKPDLIKSYRFLYGLFRRLYNLPKSITPRELLKKLENESFFSELRRATFLHEATFYGKKRLGAREIIEGVRSVATAIVKVFVREEL